MPISIQPLHATFAGEVEGVEITAPLSADQVTTIANAMDEYAVLVFREQPMTDECQLRFTRYFGDLEVPGAQNNVTRPEERRLGVGMGDLSNLDRDNRLLARDDRQRMFNLGNRLWHTDSSYKHIPAKFSLLSARTVPSAGGQTQFADMRAAYDARNEETRAAVEDLICEHSLISSRGLLGFDQAMTDEEKENFKPVHQRLVRTLAATNRRSLFLSAHAGGIVGWPVPEARSFLRDLMEAATEREFVYTHEWRPHDLVIWDNRQTMHRLRAFDDIREIRDMRRTTVAGVSPTVESSDLVFP